MDPAGREIDGRPEVHSQGNPKVGEMACQPTFPQGHGGRHDQDMRPRCADLGFEFLMLRSGEIAEGGRRRANDLKAGKAFGKPAGRQRGHAGSTPDEEQAVSLAGRQGAKLEDQVRPRHSLWQRDRSPPRGPDQGCPIGDDERRAGIDLIQIGALPRQHRIMSVGRDEEGRLAFLDQGRCGLDGFR